MSAGNVPNAITGSTTTVCISMEHTAVVWVWRRWIKFKERCGMAVQLSFTANAAKMTTIIWCAHKENAPITRVLKKGQASFFTPLTLPYFPLCHQLLGTLLGITLLQSVSESWIIFITLEREWERALAVHLRQVQDGFHNGSNMGPQRSSCTITHNEYTWNISNLKHEQSRKHWQTSVATAGSRRTWFEYRVIEIALDISKFLRHWLTKIL
jgi:hypothetical protein